MATHRHVRGRDRLLASIRQRCERAVAGHSSVLLVEGAAGFGKTRVLTAAIEIAEELGVRAGYGSATAGDQAVPMSPIFAALFEGPRPLVHPGERGKLHYLPEQRYWLLEELESLFERAAVEHPLPAAIDDAQWVDNGSLLALRTLPARLGSLPIVWIVATRGTAAPVDVRSLADRLVDDGAQRVRLSRLDEAAVAHVVTDRTGAGKAIFDSIAHGRIDHYALRPSTAGASWDAARVRGQLRQLGVRRRLVTATRPRHGCVGLTESEVQVALLVARGLTNRETADRLYLSVHTVSSHLRSAFTKLGIDSRVELANIARAAADSPQRSKVDDLLGTAE